jgi:hypothetical protein
MNRSDISFFSPGVTPLFSESSERIPHARRVA